MAKTRKSTFITLDKPLDESQKTLTPKERDNYECLQYGFKLLSKDALEEHACDVYVDYYFKLRSGGFLIYSGGSELGNRGLWIDFPKDPCETEIFMRKALLMLIEEGALKKIIAHPFELTLTIEGLPKQTLLQSKQEGDKIVLVEGQAIEQKPDNEKTPVERFIDTAYTESIGNRTSPLETVRMRFLSGEIPFAELQPLLKQNSIPNTILYKKAYSIYNLVLDNKTEMYPIFKRFIEMIAYINKEDAQQFMTTFLEKDSPLSSYGGKRFTDAMHEKRPTPETFLKETGIYPSYWKYKYGRENG